MQNINYHRELEKRLQGWADGGASPSLLLHSCCAPCSSSCLEFLAEYISVTVFYYNPNITSLEEYRFRFEEQKRFIEEMSFKNRVTLIEGDYDPERFYRIARGLEEAPERGPRCHRCYRLRLEETLRQAREGGFDYFATTLTLSPLKPADVINSIGLELAGDGQVMYLPSDFKKGNGYKRSIELSKEYNLYRQNYCGCQYSKRQSEKERSTT